MRKAADFPVDLFRAKRRCDLWWGSFSLRVFLIDLQSWTVSPPDPYRGNGCSWRLGWRCAPWFLLWVKSHLRGVGRKWGKGTVRMSRWRRINLILHKEIWRIAHCMKSGPCFYAQFHQVWSPSRSCLYLWKSGGECTSSGSPSWSPPEVMGWEPFPPRGIPGEQRAGAPARCLSPRFFCLRPSWSKSGASPYFAGSFQMLCRPKVGRQFLFKAPRVPLLLTSFA